MALWYLADKIDMDREYSEPEINSLINSLHTFGDQATLRRELINKRLLSAARIAADTGRRKTTILSKLLCSGLYKV